MLTLSPDCSKSFHLVLQLLDEVSSRDAFLLGGGTVLEARWHHRLSTDIDIFTSEQQINETMDLFIKKAQTQNWINQGIEIEQVITAQGLLGKTPHSMFSIFGGSNLFSDARSDEEIEGTGVFAQKTSEILFRIIRARILRNTFYYSRDAYDIVSSLVFEPEELQRVIYKLIPVELQSLTYDRNSTEVQIRDIEDLIKPRFPQIVSNLRLYLFDVLLGKLSRKELLSALKLPMGFRR